jgi:hypothetical protein
MAPAKDAPNASTATTLLLLYIRPFMNVPAHAVFALSCWHHLHLLLLLLLWFSRLIQSPLEDPPDHHVVAVVDRHRGSSPASPPPAAAAATGATGAALGAITAKCSQTHRKEREAHCAVDIRGVEFFDL